MATSEATRVTAFGPGFGRWLRGKEIRDMRLSDESIRGRSVIAADGQVIGEIDAIFLDSDVWRVESLKIKLRKDIADQLGAHRSVFQAGTLEIPVRIIQSLGDTVVLSVPVDDLREVLPHEHGASS